MHTKKMKHQGESARNEFIALIQAALNKAPGNQDLAHNFLDHAFVAKRFVIGKNEQSREIAALVSLDGVIDDSAKKNQQWMGIPVVSSREVPSDAIVVNCSTSISPVSVRNNLKALNLKHVLGVNELIYASSGKMNWPGFVLQQREDYENNSTDWANLYLSLEDDESKKTLLDVLLFRLTANIDYMQDYEVRIKDQYLEDFMHYDREIFVDAGGFDGDTTEEFCRRYPNYQHVYFFEPSQRNMNAAKQRLQSMANIEFKEIGLSDVSGELSFNADSGSASSVSLDGTETISVTTLDEAIPGPVSFIKMDLEGWEMNALSGSVLHIKEFSPKLAISVYHSSRDFLRVPEFIKSINRDYKIYLRHYTQGWSETVMFFRH